MIFKMSQDIYTDFRAVRLCALPHSILLCYGVIACNDHRKSPNNNMSSSMISGDLGGHSLELCCPVYCERSCLKTMTSGYKMRRNIVQLEYQCLQLC